MKEGKRIFIIGLISAVSILALLQSIFWHDGYQASMENTVYENFLDEEKNVTDEISDIDTEEVLKDKDIGNQALSDFEKENVATRKEEYKLYMDFLNGEKTTDSGMSIYDIIIPTGEPERRYYTDYTFYDSDQDGFQELHVRSARYYYILNCEKGRLSIWKFLDPRTELLNNGDFLYKHAGGAPLHYNYQYIKVNMEGETIWSISFACYDDNLDGQFDERDKYFDRNNEEMSYEEWLEIKQNYIDVGADEIFWTTLTEEI